MCFNTARNEGDAAGSTPERSDFTQLPSTLPETIIIALSSLYFCLFLCPPPPFAKHTTKMKKQQQYNVLFSCKLALCTSCTASSQGSLCPFLSWRVIAPTTLLPTNQHRLHPRPPKKSKKVKKMPKRIFCRPPPSKSSLHHPSRHRGRLVSLWLSASRRLFRLRRTSAGSVAGMPGTRPGGVP